MAGGGVRRVPLGEIAPIEAGVIERPGQRRVRVALEAVAERGWADPDVRSIWPGQMQTNWVEVEIVRK